MKKKDLKARAKNLLHKDSLSSSDVQWLLWLFKKHPSYEIKEGVGIKSISTKRTKYGTKGFYIKRIDNTETDISYIRCIDGKPSKESDIRKACRTTIRPEIVAIKESISYGVDKCPFTDTVLTRDNTHIDHFNMTFTDLFLVWIKDKDIDYLHGKINDGNEDMNIEKYFLDPLIEEDFIAFHNSNTNLRAVSSIANLSMIKLINQ